jgi:transposase-like protein
VENFKKAAAIIQLGLILRKWGCPLGQTKEVTTMQCFHCKSHDTIKWGKDRYKCNACGKTFVEWADSPFYRHRFTETEIKLVVMLYLALPPWIIQIFFWLICQKYLSKRTIVLWHKKFHPVFFGALLIQVPQTNKIWCYADEKFLTITGKQGYLWTVRDAFGNLYATLASMSRDLASAKALFKKAKVRLSIANVDCERLVSDGLQAYIKAHRILGYNCKHTRTGIQGKYVRLPNTLELVTNNYSESQNSLLAKFLAKYSYHFPTLESANDAMQTFQSLIDLRQNFEACAERRRTSRTCIGELKMAEANPL